MLASRRRCCWECLPSTKSSLSAFLRAFLHGPHVPATLMWCGSLRTGGSILFWHLRNFKRDVPRRTFLETGVLSLALTPVLGSGCWRAVANRGPPVVRTSRFEDRHGSPHMDPSLLGIATLLDTSVILSESTQSPPPSYQPSSISPIWGQIYGGSLWA